MGDQLAKGWGDPKARDIAEIRLRALGEPCRLVPGADCLEPTEAEVQAEEDMLP